MAHCRDSQTMINYDKLYEHPELPFKVKFVRTMEESLQTPQVKSLCFPSKLLGFYECFDTAKEETPLLHEWLKRNDYYFPKVVEFCDAIWKHNYLVDISDPRRRVLSVVFTVVSLQIDDIFEKLATFNDSFGRDVFKSVARVFSTQEFKPLATEHIGGHIDEKTIVECNFLIRLYHQMVLDAIDCFSPVAHKMWMEACVVTFQGFAEVEYTIRARVSKEKRYITLEEWVDMRRLPGGFNTIVPFMYDEKQVFNIDLGRYNPYDSVIAYVTQYALLFNELLSFPKEIKHADGTNMVEKYMGEKNLNVNDAFDEVVRFLDKLGNALQLLYDLTPRDQQDSFLICWRYAAAGADYMLNTPRYGWKISNATI